MAFDFAWDMRLTAGFVSDPAYAVVQLSEGYPHTYTNGNGLSINAGGGGSQVDRAGGNDPRIAGIFYVANSGTNVFQVDLSSGSAPGAGTYTLDLAMGDASAGHPEYFQVLDNTTVLIDGTGSGSGITTSSGQFVDASLALVTASTSWTGATVSKTFATTTVKINIGGGAGGDVTAIAHFRLTLAAGGDTLFAQAIF